MPPRKRNADKEPTRPRIAIPSGSFSPSQFELSSFDGYNQKAVVAMILMLREIP
jgi:hypothetical protein